MTDSERISLREDYESSDMNTLQYAASKGMDIEVVRYAFRKTLKLRRKASGVHDSKKLKSKVSTGIGFTSIQTDHHADRFKAESNAYILITTTNGTTIKIPS